MLGAFSSVPETIEKTTKACGEFIKSHIDHAVCSESNKRQLWLASVASHQHTVFMHKSPSLWVCRHAPGPKRSCSKAFEKTSSDNLVQLAHPGQTFNR